ncbi:non-ribosomal peptide synthetase, partial [Colwellia psychrerythraea]
QFNDHLSRLLTGLATVSETELVGPLQIKKLPMLSTLELDYSLNTLNDTEQDYPTDKCLHELFEAQAVANPNNIAVVFEDEQLTYQELNQQANKVAHYLAEHHDVTPNTLVGICVERSLQMVVGLLGILKAGGAYVPLDPSYPTARLQHIINDTGINYLLDQSGLHTRLELSDKVKLISINDTRFTDVFIDYPVTNRQLADKQPLSSLAYVIHTSGSTGTPKGVMIEQGAFVNFLQAMLFQLGPNFNHDLKLLAVTTMAFDIAGLEIWGPLFVGGQVVLASKDDVIDPSKLSHLLNVHDINFMQATPAGWRSLLDDDWAGKKDLVALSGGELLPDKLAKSLMRNCAQLWNCYGPTEATVWSLVRRIDCDNTRGNIANLAGPLSNYSHYVLDSTQEVVPQGVIGELYIGGTSLARGYLNNPDLTKEKFIADPFASRKDARLYRTGDLVRLVSDGQLEFVGRTDTQIKIRGFRIELGEIEHQLSSCAGVLSCIVVANKDESGHNNLVAYVIADNTTGISQDEMPNLFRKSLRAHIPDYMVPSIFVFIEQWPLTANGKIDKNSLPAYDLRLFQRQYQAAQTPTEQLLVELWSTLLTLNSDEISMDANFFELGGHSLLAVKLVTKIRRLFSLEIMIKEVFEQPSIQMLAQTIDSKRSISIVESKMKEVVIISEGSF